MAVLNTTSPTDRPGAPTEMPSKTVPSSRARIAGWVTVLAFDGGRTARARLRPAADAGEAGPFAKGVQASGNFSRPGPMAQSTRGHGPAIDPHFAGNRGLRDRRTAF